MKKIFTLIFSLGILTTATFAQSGGHRQENDRTTNPQHQVYTHPGNDQGYQSTPFHQDDRNYQSSRGKDNDRYSNDRYDNDRDRHDNYDRRDDRFGRKGYDQRMQKHYPVKQKGSLFQILLGFSGVIRR